MLISLMNAGKGELSYSAIVQFIEQMSGTEVKASESSSARA
jgi:hypothetical protein